MKKFLAVLLPIVLIGSLMSSVFVAAQPICVEEYVDRTPWPIATLPNFPYQDYDAGFDGLLLTVSGLNLRYTHTGRPHQTTNIARWGYVGLLEATGVWVYAWVDMWGNAACGTTDQIWLEVWHPWYTANDWPWGQRETRFWIFWHHGVTNIAWLNEAGAWEW